MRRFAFPSHVLAAGFLVLGAASQGLLAQGSRGSEDLRASSARPDSEEFQKRTYGTADTIIQQIPSAAFQPLGSNFNESFSYVSDQSGDFFAPLSLPNGSLVSFLDVYYFDSDSGPDQDVILVLYEVTGTDLPVLHVAARVSSSGSGGYGYNFHLISPPLQINNNNRYLIYASGATGEVASGTRSLGGANVWYRLQISPPPATATFADVPTTHPYFRAVEALAASGITSGCGGGNFCPDQSVTRGEMAVFLARALGLHWPL